MQKKMAIALLLLVLSEVFAIQISTLFFGLNPKITYFYLVTTYLVIAALVWLNKQNLEDFHLDKLTLFTLVFSSIFRRRLGIAYEGYFLMLIGFGGLLILIIAVVNRSILPKTNVKWSILGLLYGILSLIPSTIIQSFQGQAIANEGFYINNTVFLIARQFIFELSFGVPVEEIVFRGFIWGYLLKLGWAEKNAMWGQGILFWLLHFGRVGTPLIFFLSIPLLTFVSSKLTSRSRQIFPAIISHTIINSMTPILSSISV